MSAPFLSIIVCTYNRADLLLGCLESLVLQVVGCRLFEVIIVDNNSTDNTQANVLEFIKKYPNFRYVSVRSQGLSHARNCGWRKARGKYVAYIDDDAKATPRWCERILNAFETVTPTPAAVGGQILPFYETTPPPWFTDDFEIRTWGTNAGFLEPPQAMYGFSGSNMAFPRRILERFGGFSTQFGIVGGKLRMGEDAEFFYRIYDEEPNFWYDPLIMVYHWVPARNLKVMSRIIRSYYCGQSLASMQGRTITVFDYAKCLTGILFCLFNALRAMPISVPGAKRESVKFLQQLGYLVGSIVVRK